MKRKGHRTIPDFSKKHPVDPHAPPAKLKVAPPPTPKPTTAAAYLIQVRVASSRPVPRVGPGSVELFVSEAGDDVLVSWAQVDKVLYRLSTDSSWTETRELRFTPSLDINKAYDILGQRVRNR